MTTTAILCVARGESPFTEEWLEYHFSLGIDRVYYVSTDSDFARIKKSFDGCANRSRVELLHFDDFQPGWQARCYNRHLPLIQEDWVLVIDLDEYLYLNAFSCIGEFLESVDGETSQVQFPWLILLSPNYFESRVLDIVGKSEKFISDHVKSMVRRDCITRLGIHSHKTHRLKNCLSSGHRMPARNKHRVFFSNQQFFNRNPFILHFFSRGHMDLMNRILDHRHFNAKNGLGERNRLSSFLTGPASWSNIPNRFLLTKFMSALPTANVQCDLPIVGAQTDLHDLESMFLNNIKNILNFECREDTILTTYFENCYRLSQKLSGLDLSEVCNLDDYFKCNSQLEYVTKLRNAM